MEEEEEIKLTGKALMVYLYALRKNKVTSKEVKEELGFSSQSLAIYYLERLYQMDLLNKEPGGYYSVKKRLNIGIYSFYLNVYGYLLPKFLPYSVFFTLFFVLYLLFKFPNYDIFVITILSIVNGIFWYETIKLYLRLKRMLKKK
jgi:hypothetical protein